jgi:Tol biopolymer transport system component
VFVGLVADGRQQLWLRPMNGPAQPLKGTDSPQFPFWSPDGKSIGFAASGLLKRIDLQSGAVRKVANAPLFLGGAWLHDGTIVFAANSNSPLSRVSAEGGEPVVVTRLEPGTAHSFPSALPDGRQFLYYATGSAERRGVYIGDVSGMPGRQLLMADAPAINSPTGDLLFVQKGALLARRFDVDRGVLSGASVPVVDRIVTTVFAGAPMAVASVSAAGPIVYRSDFSIPSFRFQVRRLDRGGNVLSTFHDEPIVLNPSLSPSGRQMMMFTGAHLWLLDLQTLTQHPLTNGKYFDFAGVWSPDGRQIAYCSLRDGAFNLFLKDATGAGEEQALLRPDETKMPTDWSSSGYLLFRSLSPKGSFDIWALRMTDRGAFPVVRTDAEERDGQFSHDGSGSPIRPIAPAATRSGSRPLRQRAPGTRTTPAGSSPSTAARKCAGAPMTRI